MTKSQNTKNEQLTEQFNHGLLPDGWYYYKASDGRSNIATEYGLFCIEADNKVKVEVLEKVPSYEEWEQLQNWADFTDDYHELREKLEIAEYEKVELKELLKRCYSFIDWCELGVPVAQRPILMKDINKALGEEK